MLGFCWKFGLVIAVWVIATCHSQTFQYSRGWTNGKRGGGQPIPPSAVIDGSSQGQFYGSDPGVVGIGVPMDTDTSALPIRVGLTAQGRLRRVEYPQGLGKKISASGGSISSGPGNSNLRKPPMWILGLDQDNANSGDF